MSLAREVTLDQVVTVDNDQVVTETRSDDDVDFIYIFVNIYSYSRLKDGKS